MLVSSKAGLLRLVINLEPLDKDDAGMMILSHSFYFQHHFSFSRNEMMESTCFGDGLTVWNSGGDTDKERGRRSSGAEFDLSSKLGGRG